MRIELRFPPKELNPNWSGSFRQFLRVKMAYRDECYWKTLEQVGRWRPAEHGTIPVTLTIFKPDRRKYDDDNLEGRAKRSRDGVAKALGVDDNRFKVTRVISDEIKKGGMIVFEFE